MTVIHGKKQKIVKVVEVGTKYRSIDGIIFDSEIVCKCHENTIRMNTKKEKFHKAMERITKDEFKNPMDKYSKYYVVKINSYKDIVSLCKDLRLDRHYYVVNKIKKSDDFPLKCVCKLCDNTFDDDWSFEYTFLTDKDIKNKLNEAIEIIDNL